MRLCRVAPAAARAGTRAGALHAARTGQRPLGTGQRLVAGARSRQWRSRRRRCHAAPLRRRRSAPSAHVLGRGTAAPGGQGQQCASSGNRPHAVCPRCRYLRTPVVGQQRAVRRHAAAARQLARLCQRPRSASRLDSRISRLGSGRAADSTVSSQRTVRHVARGHGGCADTCRPAQPTAVAPRVRAVSRRTDTLSAACQLSRAALPRNRGHGPSSAGHFGNPRFFATCAPDTVRHFAASCGMVNRSIDQGESHDVRRFFSKEQVLSSEQISVLL